MAYAKKTHDKAKRLYLQGYSVEEIAKKMKINSDTLYRWKKEENWESPAITDDTTLADAKRQLKKIFSGGEITDAQIKKADKLSKVIERMERTQVKEEKEIRKQRTRNKFEAKKLDIEYIGSLKDKFFDRLYPYQREFWMDPYYVKMMLKSRRVGMSYTAGGFMLVNALEKQRDQICTSASQDQALIVKRFSQKWAKELGVDWLPDTEKAMVLPGGYRLRFLPPNPYTIQGYDGDVYLDEWSWIRKAKMVYDLLLPSIAEGDRTFSGWSTPYTITTHFGELMTAKEGEYAFDGHRYTTDIYRAVKDGLNVNIDKMRALFDADTFALLFECKFFSDEMALLKVGEVQDAIDDTTLKYTDNFVNAGTDIGRHHDLTATVLTEMLESMVYVRHLFKMYKVEWEEQQKNLAALHEYWRIKKHLIDRTGSGDQLTEWMVKRFFQKVLGIWFTTQIKEKMALNLLRLFQARLIKIPNDRDFILHLHAIKRKPGENGFKYDAERNEQIKHADWFWGLALSCMPYDIRQRIITEANFDSF